MTAKKAYVTRSLTGPERLAFLDAIEQAEDDGTFGAPTETRPWRHGTIETYVMPFDGEHWRFRVRVHHSEGWEQHPEPMVIVKVVAFEVKVTQWRAVEVVVPEPT